MACAAYRCVSHNLRYKLRFTPRCMYTVKHCLVPHLLHCNVLRLLSLVVLTPDTSFTPAAFRTRHFLQTTFTPSTFCIKQLLHQTPSTPHTVYTRHLLHQTPFTRDTFYTTRLLHKNLGGVWYGKRFFQQINLGGVLYGRRFFQHPSVVKEFLR